MIAHAPRPPFPLRVLDMLGSTRVGMGALLFIAAWGILGTTPIFHGLTLPETPWLDMTPAEYYAGAVMKVALGVLMASIAAALVRRLAWRWRSAPLFIVHAGVLVLCVGIIQYAHGYKEGELALWRNENPSQLSWINAFFVRDSAALYRFTPAGTSVEALPPLPHRHPRVFAGGIPLSDGVRLLEYRPDVVVESALGADESNPAKPVPGWRLEVVHELPTPGDTEVVRTLEVCACDPSLGTAALDGVLFVHVGGATAPRPPLPGEVVITLSGGGAVVEAPQADPATPRPRTEIPDFAVNGAIRIGADLKVRPAYRWDAARLVTSVRDADDGQGGPAIRIAFADSSERWLAFERHPIPSVTAPLAFGPLESSLGGCSLALHGVRLETVGGGMTRDVHADVAVRAGEESAPKDAGISLNQPLAMETAAGVFQLTIAGWDEEGARAGSARFVLLGVVLARGMATITTGAGVILLGALLSMLARLVGPYAATEAGA